MPTTWKWREVKSRGERSDGENFRWARLLFGVWKSWWKDLEVVSRNYAKDLKKSLMNA